MQQENTLLDGISKTLLSKVWNDIELMPINVWRKITETGDLDHLYKSEGDEITDSILSNVWLNCWQQYLDEFGIAEEIKRRMSIQRRLVKFNSKYVLTKNRDLLNRIEIAEKELEGLNSSTEVKFYELLDIVSTKKGFRIDPNQFTVIEWYHALNNINKNVRNQGESNN